MKKIGISIIILLIVISCLFPPWLAKGSTGFSAVGYGFIAKPPKLESRYYNANTIDVPRLGVQVGLLLFLGSCIVFSKYIFPSKTEKE